MKKNYELSYGWTNKLLYSYSLQLRRSLHSCNNSPLLLDWLSNYQLVVKYFELKEATFNTKRTKYSHTKPDTGNTKATRCAKVDRIRTGQKRWATLAISIRHDTE